MNRSQARAKTRDKRTPRGAARAARRRGKQMRFRPAPAPDANCVTLPDGDCVATEPCMHSEPAPC